MAVREDETTRREGDDPHDSVERGPKSEGLITILRGHNPGMLYALDRHESVIGRSPDVELPLNDEALSRRHACIRRLGDGFAIEDLGSKNGTFVDGERVEGPLLLADGARISLGGRTVLHFGLRDAVEIEAARQTQALTVRDPLTGVFNRRHLEERLASEIAYAARHGTAVSLLLLDLDHFKRINDDHGHAAGDAALRLAAQALSAMLREEDVLARYGGEEFAVVVRCVDREGTRQLAERMRQEIKARRLPTDEGELAFTTSIGVSHCSGASCRDAARLFAAADRALYAAKNAGRDRVELAGGDEDDGA